MPIDLKHNYPNTFEAVNENIREVSEQAVNKNAFNVSTTGISQSKTIFTDDDIEAIRKALYELIRKGKNN